MEDIIKIIGVFVALSGWTKVFLDYRSHNPKIIGRIINVMIGQIPNPKDSSKTLTTFTAYPYLLNARNNQMHILDYQMEVRVNGKWLNLERVYGIEKTENLQFTDSKGQPIIVEKFNKNLIYAKCKPVQQGIPMHGWIMFAGDESLHQSDIEEYKLICIDANLKKHTIKTKVKELQNIFLLQEMANIQLTKDAISD